MKNKNLRKEAIAIQARAITLSLTAVFLIYLTLSMSSASALLGLSGQSTKTKGATTITWDSSFQDPSYTIGNTITMTVTWTVDYGTAVYDSFVLREKPGFTPKGNDSAEGEIVTPASVSGDSATIEFRFTDLHLDRRRNVEIGNAKFKLYLMVDEDGNGVVDLLVGYGVNVHVEDPQ